MTPKGGVSPHTKFRVAAKKAEVLFTDYIAEHLTPDGRDGVIVPNGIVATTQNAYVKLRKFLVGDSLVAVVSLPAGVFKPYSGVKTSILFLDKRLARQTKEILFLKITADGFDLGDQRREITANDLPEAERVVKAWLKGKLDEASSTRTFRLTSKSDLLVARAVPLSAEQYTDGTVATIEVETVRLGDVCGKCQQINPTPTGRRVSAKYCQRFSVSCQILPAVQSLLTRHSKKVCYQPRSQRRSQPRAPHRFCCILARRDQPATPRVGKLS